MTWWNKPFRIVQTNLREIDASLDVERVLDDIQALHGNTWLINTGGIVSFYPSKLAFQHPSPWLVDRASGDLIGDAVSAAHQRGVRVISRLDFSKIHADLYQQHPDWCVHSRDGQPQIYNGLHSTDPCGPYYQEHSLEVLSEILETYPVDGIFFNMFGYAEWDYSGSFHDVRHGVHTRRRFFDRFGREIPTERDDPDWRTFMREIAEDLSARMRAHIHATRPGVGLFLYSHAGDGDVLLHEVNTSLTRPQWSYQAGENAKRSQGKIPGSPITVNSVLFLDIPYRFAAEQPAHVGLRLAQAIAHGANPYIYMIGPTTVQTDRRNHAICRDIYSFHERHADYYTELRSPAQIALVAPPDRAAFRGFYRVLVESHIQFDVLEQHWFADCLDRYKLLILPAVQLTGTQRAAVEMFLAAGGKVIATYEPLDPETILYQRDDMRSAYLRLDDSIHIENVDQIPLLGAYRYTEYMGTPSLPMVAPSRYGPPEKVHGAEQTDWPGLIRTGNTAYLPWQPDRYYDEQGLAEYRHLLAQIVISMMPGPPLVETTAGPAVEVVLRDQPQRRIVHFINYSGQNGRTFFDPVPLHDIQARVRVDHPVTRVHSGMLDQDLRFEQSDGHVTFTLPHLDLFDMVVVQ